MSIEVQGLKYDDEKPRWELLPLETIEEIVKVLTYGAKKYSDNSWQRLDNGIERYYAASMRHITSWRTGEEIDPESGLPHLSHVFCNVMFIIWLTQYGEPK